MVQKEPQYRLLNHLDKPGNHTGNCIIQADHEAILSQNSTAFADDQEMDGFLFRTGIKRKKLNNQIQYLTKQMENQPHKRKQVTSSKGVPSHLIKKTIEESKGLPATQPEHNKENSKRENHLKTDQPNENVNKETFVFKARPMPHYHFFEPKKSDIPCIIPKGKATCFFCYQ